VTFEPLTPERRRAMTRQHLLDAAAIVFARNGFHGSTLDEVAATAGFTKGAVYSNFKSKDDLFLELVDDRIDRQFAVVSEVWKAAPATRRSSSRASARCSEATCSGMTAFITLWLEFVLYARRNPEAQAKLAASVQRSRAQVQALIEHEYATIRGEPGLPDARARRDLLGPLQRPRTRSPRQPIPGSQHETLDTTLSFLYAAMGVDGADESPG